MRILVAGATGSIGIHVVNTAIAMGHQPVTLVRNRRKIKLLPRGTDIFYGDVSIPETLTDLPKDIDAIIFTLGSDGQGRIGARAIDYGGVRNILRIFMDTPVRIALMTTIGVTERLSSWNQRTEVHDWATVLLLLLFACHSTIANAAVALGATRVIYPANQKQVLLPVTNNDPASVYLIQSWIENAGDQKDTQFVITPPLFSMQGKKENTLRIINATNHQLPGDRESLFWVNVKAIPAMEKDQKNENTLQLAIISRIKMFYRPTHLAMAPEEAPAMLRFRRSGSKLTLINPTPYFITVTNMKAGNSNLPNTMVPPKGEVSVDIPHAVTGDISFQTINDYGALTPRIKATMQ
ncbi:type 1 fimbriae periplasmic chaperone (modular protein) [Escherichia coli]|nr:type 1 fimbriae periplasmic chaperone (modular protein) [Escherichia coli]